MRTTTTVLLVAATLAACGDRVITAGDGALTQPDASGPADACVLPAGWCHSDQDCPAGQVCEGCYTDPCAPFSRGCVGHCVSPGGCTSNADCEGTQFCYFASGCGKAGPGVCKDAPGGCTADCPGVCGCDGVTYCNACGAYKAGTSVDKTGAACAKSCAALNQAYMAAVQQAKACCATCLVDDQCGQLVWHALPTGCPCPCQTYVNQANTAALQQLKTLEQQWLAQGCGPGLPPPQDMECCALYPACPELEFGATCTGSSAQGTCQDNPSP
jgi:hypothetical protein